MPGLNGRLVRAELTYQGFNPHKVLLRGRHDQPTGFRIGKNLGVRHGSQSAVGGLIPVKLLHKRRQAAGFFGRSGVDEARLERRRLAGAGFQLGDNVGRRLEV